MTCVSERSGTASRAVWKSAATPNPTAIRTPMTVNRRWRAQRPISRSIIVRSPFLRCGAERALRTDEEISRGHDDVSLVQPADHLVESVRVPAELDVVRHEPTAAEIDEDHVP